MTMAKRSNTVLLADDILLHQILPRLPLRSLGCFKCVCKQWRSLLTTPEFTKMHLHQVNNQNQPKQLIIDPTTKPCKYFRTINCETPEVGLSANLALPFKANYDEISIIASLNGLVCLGIDSFQPRSRRYKDIILWNPLTGEYKTLPKDNFHLNGFQFHAIGFGLYYSCCDDDYKLLRVTLFNDAFIYSLKSDSWRKVESTNCRGINSRYWNSSCLLNEDLYFFERSINNMNVQSYSIIRFDTNTEKFTKIAAPSLLDVAKCCFSLTAVSGCVYLCASSNVNSLDRFALWKMDDRDGEWTKVVSCCGSPSTRGFYQLLHVMKNGNLLVGSRGEGAYEVDLKMKTTKMVCNTEGPMDFLWGGKFVETIVSLKKIKHDDELTCKYYQGFLPGR